MPSHFHHNKEMKIDKNPKMSHDDPHLSALSSAPKEFIAISLPSSKIHPHPQNPPPPPKDEATIEGDHKSHTNTKKKKHGVPNTSYALIEAAMLTVILTFFFFSFLSSSLPKRVPP